MVELSKALEGVGEATSIRYNNMVYDLQRQGKDVIVLSLGEAFFELPVHSLGDLPSPDLFHYSHSRGLPGLRAKLASYYEKSFGVTAAPESQVLVTAGSKIGIFMTLLALLDPGDEVIVHEPAWVSYVDQIRLCRGVPVLMPHDAEWGDVGRFVSPRTKVIIMNTPNNPRGSLVSTEELGIVHDVAERGGLHLLSDEAYAEFVPEGSRFVSAGDGDPQLDHTVIVNSLSKVFGVSGWRIGYLLSNAPMISAILMVNQHLITCAPTVLCQYVERHFEEFLGLARPQIAAVLKKRRAVTDHLDQLGFDYLPGEATFYLFVSIAGSALGSEEFCRQLLVDRGVSVVPGVGYGPTCDGFVRVSVGTESLHRTFRGLDAIRDLVDATARPTR